jgi:diguanylate cyclase (GGDEF)-like protein
MQIYFADDSEDERDIMEATLASGGYEEIHVATSGIELLARLGIAPHGEAAARSNVILPDVILLDVRMPGIDGIETCARIRADPRFQHTPILMVTSLDDLDTLNQAFVAGANDYINKPYNRIELLARIRAAIRLKREMERRFSRERELLAAQEVKGLRPRDTAVVIDPATGLLLREVLEGYVMEAGAAATRLGVLALHIDHLDAFERVHGPTAQHDLLKQVASVLRHTPASLGDMLSHFNLGLFIALMHDVGLDDMAVAARRAEQAVRALAIPHRGAQTANIVTVSIGVAVEREPRLLLSAAVAAMEQAANRGGNRIIFA